MIDREAIEKRIAELETERDNAIAKFQALTGALQDCHYWLGQVEQLDVKGPEPE